MNTLLNIKAFLVVARTGSFSAAARELTVAPSVVTKRITRLEDQMGAQLFIRSTRALTLTPAGERLLPSFQRLVAELEEVIGGGGAAPERGIEGHLRIKGPTTITSLLLAGIFSDFHARHPGLTIDVVLMDRSVNPLEENFDMVIGALPASFPNVIDVPLCPYPVVVVASPEYLREHGTPEHPTDVIEHDCLTSVLLGTTWPFERSPGTVSVEVRSKMHANDGRVLREAARRGNGIAPLPQFLVEEDLRNGTLVQVLEQFPVPLFWLKALVPRIKMSKPAVSELVSYLKMRMQPNPWAVAQTG
jgi:DNA-binding transcriptional LysR family regulator